jgi:hypothetical protein
MTVSDRYFVDCPNCKEKKHPAGTNFCPLTGKPLHSFDGINFKGRKIKGDNKIIEDVVSILEEVKNGERKIKDFLYLDPYDIKSKRKRNAIIKTFKLNKEEQVLGLIDLSEGKFRNCLLFGRKGIYFNNRWRSREPGAYRVTYLDLISYEFSSNGKGEIEVGKLHIIDLGKISNPNHVKDDIVKILNLIKKAITLY